jgi:hypothetical protein
MTNKSIAKLGLLVVLCLACTVANAQGFNGYYDYGTWSSSNTLAGGYTVSSTNPGQTTVTLNEPDGCFYNGSCGPQEFDFSHTVASSGTVSFDWNFNASADACCSGLNFYVNGFEYNLTGGDFGNPYGNFSTFAGGTFTVGVNAGDVITFGAFSADGCCDATINTISNFSAPNDTPEPASLALLGTGLVGLAGAVRRRLA